jgi:type II secretory ATPase GspE/PulE/Tfp pilus assembly ATPase PilB-like protein
VRKLCPHCKVAYTPDEKLKEGLYGKIGKYIKDKENLTLYKAHLDGCEKCNNT